MKRIKTLWLVATILLFSITLVGQDNKPSAFSYSLSYIPPSLLSSDGEFEFVPIYLNVEANIHYKPFDFISFTSGLGYYKDSEPLPLVYNSSSTEHSNYQDLHSSGLRLPLQLNIHFTKAPLKTDSYFKVVYTNGFIIHKIISYENDVATGTKYNSAYFPSVGLGLGGIFLKNKPVGIIVEGTIEKYFRYDLFKDATWYSLKIGVII
jgi:hypothetical protein